MSTANATFQNLPVLSDEMLDQIKTLEAARPGIGAQLVDLFETNAPALLNRMRVGVAQADLDAARVAAHSLKGSASSLGAQRVAAMAKSMEHRLAAGEAVDAIEIDALQTAVHDATDILKAYFM